MTIQETLKQKTPRSCRQGFAGASVGYLLTATRKDLRAIRHRRDEQAGIVDRPHAPFEWKRRLSLQTDRRAKSDAALHLFREPLGGFAGVLRQLEVVRFREAVELGPQ
jgi:hypothetical protein